MSLTSFGLAGFFTLAGFSKFGNRADRVFLSHKFMVGIYESLTPVWNKILGLTLEAATLRHAVGYTEFAAALLLLTPLRKLGAGVALGIMGFATASHALLKDPVSAFAVPGLLGAGCLTVLLSSDEDKDI